MEISNFTTHQVTGFFATASVNFGLNMRRETH